MQGCGCRADRKDTSWQADEAYTKIKYKKLFIVPKDNMITKIGLIKETKNPVDNRVALTPQEIINLQQKYSKALF